MADCKVHNHSPQEVRNMIEDEEYIYTIYPDQTQKITAEYFEHTQSRVKVGDVTDSKGDIKSVYVDVDTLEQVLKHRVTDEQSKVFKRKVGVDEAKRISELPDNIIGRDTGTFVHSIMQQLVLHSVENGSPERLAKIRSLAANSDFAIDAANFNMLQQGATKILNQIYDTQKRIDSETGTKGKVKIYTEQVIIDPIHSIGGTIDMLALFSDNTASVYDYKTMKAESHQKIGSGMNTELITDFVPIVKYEGFTMQLGEIQRIITSLYGVKYIRESRIVPILVENGLKTIKEERSKGSSFTKKVTVIQIGSEVSEYLEQIAISEQTGIPGMDKLINGQINIVSKLRDQVKETFGDERDALYSRINTITRALNKLIIKRDVDMMLTDIIELTRKIDAETRIPKTLDDNSRNPEYMTIQNIIDYHQQFTLYANMLQMLKIDMEKLKASNPEGYKEIRARLFTTNAVANATVNTLENLIAEEAMSLMNSNDLLDNGRLKVQPELDFLDLIFTRHSQIDHPIFVKLKELTDRAYFRRDQQIRVMADELEEKQKALFSWAGTVNLSNKQAFEKLINMKTGNMYGVVTQEFYDQRKQAFKDKDTKWLKEHYEIFDEAVYKTRYESRLKVFSERKKRERNNLKDLLDDDNNLIHNVAYYTKLYNQDIALWVKQNSLLTSTEAWAIENNYGSLTMKKATLEKFKSAEYKYIESNAPLKAYYDMVEKYNKEFRTVMGLSYGELKPGFIPNIRKDAIDRIIAGNSSAGDVIGEMIDSLKVREEDIYIKNQDLNTGEIQNHIPILFLQPIRDSDGNVRIDEKSFDLSNVMLQWGKVAYNYQHMSAIEDEVMVMKQYLALMGEESQVNAQGHKLIHQATGLATKHLGTASNAYQAFDKLVNFHLYGVRYGETGIMGATSKSGFSAKKSLLAAKNYLSVTRLGMGFFPGVAAFSQGHVSALIEAKKGVSFNMKQWTNTLKLFSADTKKVRGMCDFFHVYAVDYTYKRALELSRSKATSLFSTHTAFLPIRLGDESVDDTVLVSMAQNYGIDVDGNIRRLQNLAPGAKSILQMATVDKDGKFKMDLKEDSYIQFRNAVRDKSMYIKGTMNDQDVAQHNLNLAISMAMQFKTWIPGVLEERFGKLSYSKTLDAVNYGRYRAYFSEYDTIQGASFAEYMGKVVAPNILKLIADIGTFGLSAKVFNRVDEKRAKNGFDKWRTQEENSSKVDTWYRAAFSTWKNMNVDSKISFKEWITSHNKEANDMVYKEFLDAKHKQIDAMTTELRIIIGLTIGIIALGSISGDDDKKWYYQSWTGRTLFKSLNRVHSELAFTYSPTQFLQLTATPFPVLTLLDLAWKTIKNTADELRDSAFGENSPQDKTPYGYYSSQWIPGVMQMRRFIEVFDQDKKNPFKTGL